GGDGKTTSLAHHPAPCVVDATGGTSILRKDEPMYSRNSPNMLNILSATSDLEFSNSTSMLHVMTTSSDVDFTNSMLRMDHEGHDAKNPLSSSSSVLSPGPTT
ncbi:hypothetical protein EGW08_004014, partial [Elysia chlorotica]